MLGFYLLIYKSSCVVDSSCQDFPSIYFPLLMLKTFIYLFYSSTDELGLPWWLDELQYCQLQAYSRVFQVCVCVRVYIYSVILLLFLVFRLSSLIGYYNILSMVPCTIQQVLVCYLLPWTEKPGGLQSTGSQRHDSSNFACRHLFC